MSLLLHALNAALLYLVLRRATGSAGRSAFVAALFAIHPLRAESVAWVAERKDVLSGLFWMLSLGAWVLHSETRKKRWYAAALASFALGLMAKPMLVSLPFVLLLFDFWPLGRTRLAQAAAPPAAGWNTGAAREPAGALRLVLEQVPFLALAAVSSLVTYLAQQRGGMVMTAKRIPLAERFANALVSYSRYAMKLVWPSNLSAFYPRPHEWPVMIVAGAALLFAAATTAAILAARTRPWVATGWGWYVVTLLPVIGLVQVGLQSMADRYTYLPLIGLSILVAWGVPDLARAIRLPGSATTVLAGAVLLALAITAQREVGAWKDDLTLFARALRSDPGNGVAQNVVEYQLARRGNLEEALGHLREAVRLAPRYARARANLGLVLDMQGKSGEALAEYKEAVRLDPRDAAAQNNLGASLAEAGRFEEAIPHYRDALTADPGYAEARNNWGSALAEPRAPRGSHPPLRRGAAPEAGLPRSLLQSGSGARRRGTGRRGGGAVRERPQGKPGVRRGAHRPRQRAPRDEPGGRGGGGVLRGAPAETRVRPRDRRAAARPAPRGGCPVAPLNFPEGAGMPRGPARLRHLVRPVASTTARAPRAGWRASPDRGFRPR